MEYKYTSLVTITCALISLLLAVGTTYNIGYNDGMRHIEHQYLEVCTITRQNESVTDPITKMTSTQNNYYMIVPLHDSIESSCGAKGTIYKLLVK